MTVGPGSSSCAVTAPDAELIPVDGDVLPESTLDALLTYLAQQAESGEGVR